MKTFLGRAASVIAALALIAVVVYIFLPESTDEEPVTSPSPSASPTYEPPPDYTTPDVSPAITNTPPPVSGTPAANLTQYEINLPVVSSKLTMMMPDTFESTENSEGYFYYYKPANDQLVYIEVVLRMGDAAENAPGFLTGYLPNSTGFTDPIVSAVGNVPDAQYVSVYNDSQFFEAWLINAGSDRYIAVVAGYQTEEQRAVFLDVLDTLELLAL